MLGLTRGREDADVKKMDLKKNLPIWTFSSKKIANKPGNRGQASNRIQDHYVDRSVLKIYKL